MILDQMIRSGINSADITDLISEGFVPDFVTGYHKNRFQADEFSCFDIKYKMRYTPPRIATEAKGLNMISGVNEELERISHSFRHNTIIAQIMDIVK